MGASCLTGHSCWVSNSPMGRASAPLLRSFWMIGLSLTSVHLGAVYHPFMRTLSWLLEVPDTGIPHVCLVSSLLSEPFSFWLTVTWFLLWHIPFWEQCTYGNLLGPGSPFLPWVLTLTKEFHSVLAFSSCGLWPYVQVFSHTSGPLTCHSFAYLMVSFFFAFLHFVPSKDSETRFSLSWIFLLFLLMETAWNGWCVPVNPRLLIQRFWMAHEKTVFLNWNELMYVELACLCENVTHCFSVLYS